MTEETGKSDAASLEAADLDLVATMADAGKNEEDLWNEFEAADTAETSPVEPVETDFDDGDGGQPDGEETASEAPEEAAAAKEAGASDAPDIWANATKEQRDAYEALRSEKEKLDHRIKSDDGRVAAYQRRIDKLLKQVQSRPAKGQQESRKAREELAPLEEDYPDIVKPVGNVLERFEQKINEADAADEARRIDAEAELVEIVRAETGKVLDRHPDYDQFLKQHGQAFVQWVEDQPRAVRDAAYLNADFIRDGEAAIKVIDAFKAHLNPPPAAEPAPGQTPSPQSPPLDDKRRRQLNATAAPARTGGRPTVSGIPEDGDPEAIWQAFDALDERRRDIR